MNELATNSSRWKPGQSGNPNGRAVGSRNAFSAAFFADLQAVWAEHGRDVMARCAKLSPEIFFATAARVIPKDVQLSIEQQYPSGLTPEDLAILRAIKEAIPDAGSRSPAEVLSYVRDTLASVAAKTIDSDCTE